MSKFSGQVFVMDYINSNPIMAITGLQYTGQHENLGWSNFNYCVNNPIFSDEMDDQKFRRSYLNYEVVATTVGPNVLLMSSHGDIIEHYYKCQSDLPGLTKKRVIVEKLTDTLVTEKKMYKIFMAYVSIKGQTSALNSMAFYGKDLASAELFEKHRGLFDCHTLGISDLTSGFEILRISDSGSFSLYIKDSHRSEQVLTLFEYISSNGFM